MKLEIDTTKKTICILEEAPLSQILEFLQNFDTENYKLISKHTSEIVEKGLRYIPYPSPWVEPINPYNPIWVQDSNSQPLYQTT